MSLPIVCVRTRCSLVGVPPALSKRCPSGENLVPFILIFNECPRDSVSPPHVVSLVNQLVHKSCTIALNIRWCSFDTRFASKQGKPDDDLVDDLADDLAGDLANDLAVDLADDLAVDLADELFNNELFNNGSTTWFLFGTTTQSSSFRFNVHLNR